MSFDLPAHGARADGAYACTPLNCIGDLAAVFEFAGSLSSDISLFACSIGAYFSLLAYHKLKIKQSLFLSVFKWGIPTAILYGSDDNITEWEEIAAFAAGFKADVKVLDHGEHYFHTQEQLRSFDAWANENLL